MRPRPSPRRTRIVSVFLATAAECSSGATASPAAAAADQERTSPPRVLRAPTASSLVAADNLVAGNASIGTVDYPHGGMRRVSKLTLSSDNYKGLYAAVYDGTRYAYFSTSHGSWVIKVDLSGDVPLEIGAVQCAGAGNFTAGAIDPAAGYAYFGSVAKIKLDDGTGIPACVGALALGSNVGGMVIDTSDPDPAKHTLLAGTFDSPAKIFKIDPGAGDTLPSVTGSISLDGAGGENMVRRVVLDSRDPLAANHAGLFGVIGLGSAPALVVKVAFGAGNNPVRIGASVSDPGDHNLGSAVIDPAHGFAYFGSYGPDDPARLIRFALGDAGAAPVRLGHQLLAPGEILLSTAVADPVASFAWFGCDLTYPANIYKWNLNTFSEMQSLTLQGGTQVPPANGVNEFDSPETLYGEVFLQSSVIDPDRGYAWFGTDSDKGQVVKVALSQKSAVKASRVTVGEIAVVQDLAFYAHAASGHVRLAIYDDNVPKNLLWQSAPMAVPAGWSIAPVDAPEPLVLPPATYWLAWQVDSNDNVPSYSQGAPGDGWTLEQSWGDFPPAIAAATGTNETWSTVVHYLPDRIFEDNFGL